ncbi:cholesterol transport system auxiliary component [Nitrosospira sp. Nsp14]|uniref:ABC-type transport auxiliary lipoprotein family protein n=1 Tax=Nitrosospira sp. Nsp14 TaxID=1855333 RepID=UPI0008E7D7FF|nr:ABC-type transport auxiliary lipoprotein family protein [Nitrosospira sp. Nsp14]SFH44078.1 cholesterol transport system auxiliary component [Nitrosospira sp. Nsp14]
MMNWMPQRCWRRVGLVAALVLLSSCSILPKKTVEVYQLPPSSITIATAPDRLPLTLHIAKADSSRVTDSQRVVILNKDNHVSAYKSVRWSDPPPVLLRNQIASAFRADGRLSLVSDYNPTLARDLELSGDLGAFHVEYADGKPVVVIRFYAVLAHPGLKRSISARGFESRQPVKGKGMPEVVAAFGKGADDVAREIIEWTIQHGSAIQAGENEMPASAGRMNPPAEKP